MHVEVSLRANMAIDMAKGELKQKLAEVLSDFEAGKDFPFEKVRPSPTRPGVFIANLNDHLLFFQRRENAIRVMDIVPTPEGYV